MHLHLVAAPPPDTAYSRKPFAIRRCRRSRAKSWGKLFYKNIATSYHKITSAFRYAFFMCIYDVCSCKSNDFLIFTSRAENNDGTKEKVKWICRLTFSFLLFRLLSSICARLITSRAMSEMINNSNGEKGKKLFMRNVNRKLRRRCPATAEVEHLSRTAKDI